MRVVKDNAKLQNIVTVGRLKTARLESGLSHDNVNSAFAQRERSVPNIESIEDHKVLLSVEMMFFLCDLYSVRPSYIVSGIGISSKSEYAQAIEQGYAMAVAHIKSELEEMENES